MLQVSYWEVLDSCLVTNQILVCRKGGPLAVTDANLVLGRLLPDYFPKIFGPSEKEPLDVDASKRAFEKLAQKINAEYGNEAGGEAKGQEEGQEGKMGLDEVVYG
jgi:5-oxoprolinase (ATP-hydrolysing)